MELCRSTARPAASRGLDTANRIVSDGPKARTGNTEFGGPSYAHQKFLRRRGIAPKVGCFRTLVILKAPKSGTPIRVRPGNDGGKLATLFASIRQRLALAPFAVQRWPLTETRSVAWESASTSASIAGRASESVRSGAAVSFPDERTRESSHGSSVRISMLRSAWHVLRIDVISFKNLRGGMIGDGGLEPARFGVVVARIRPQYERDRSAFAVRGRRTWICSIGLGQEPRYRSEDTRSGAPE